MTNISDCHHVDAAPVEVRDYTTGGTKTVAHVCRDCLTRLPGNWGCTECVWETTEIRELWQLVPDQDMHTIRPCAVHTREDCE